MLGEIRIFTKICVKTLQSPTNIKLHAIPELQFRNEESPGIITMEMLHWSLKSNNNGKKRYENRLWGWGMTQQRQRPGTLANNQCHATHFFINSSPLGEKAAIKQTTFSNVFSWMENFEFWLKFHRKLIPRVPLTITSIGLNNGLVPNRRQAIIWTNVHPILWCTYGTNGTELTLCLPYFYKNFFTRNFDVPNCDNTTVAPCTYRSRYKCLAHPFQQPLTVKYHRLTSIKLSSTLNPVWTLTVRKG